MKKWIPLTVVAVFALWVLSGMRATQNSTEFKVLEFGKLPVLLDGRIKPIDTIARNSLLFIRGSQTVPRRFSDDAEAPAKRERLSATEWLLEVAMRPEDADRRYTFRFDHPDVVQDLGLEGKGIAKSGLAWYSMMTLQEDPKVLETVFSEARRISENKIDTENQTPAERHYLKLYRAVTMYNRIKNSFRPAQSDDFEAEVADYMAIIPPGMEAFKNRADGREFDAAAIETFGDYVGQYDMVNNLAYPMIIPPEDTTMDRTQWSNIGTNLLAAIRSQKILPAVQDYAEMATGYRRNDPVKFNAAIDDLTVRMDERFAPEISKGNSEAFFNHFDPFYKSQIIYVCGMLCALVFWLTLNEKVRTTAFYLVTLALVIHTVGIIYRMVLEGRPPVTNLYSSALFVGWGAGVLGVILERVYRNGIGLVVASAIGIVTLMIAHYLSLDGDTMTMMVAVLDTNAWLATHVVIIVLGYSATYVAGFIALLYIALGIFTKVLTTDSAKSLARMVYGIVCFATLLSFVGTVLGGIWADQSWGRFWGWDPKENGALLIVIWNATILHARWGGMIRERGMMTMAVFGNVITSFSWFGVNLLGEGLHNYGFMEGSFKWLTLFCVSQVIIILLGVFVPKSFWLSFKKSGDGGGTAPVAS